MSGQVNKNVTSTSAQILQGVGKLEIDGVDVGGYVGGVNVTWAQRELFVESEWQLGPVDSEVTMYEVTISTELEEATLEHLAIGWGLHSSSVLSGTSSKILTLNPEQAMLESQLVFEGMSGTVRTKTRVFTFTKAVRVGSSQTRLNRGVKTTVPVTWRCLMSSSSFGNIVDNTVTA